MIIFPKAAETFMMISRIKLLSPMVFINAFMIEPEAYDNIGRISTVSTETASDLIFNQLGNK